MNEIMITLLYTSDIHGNILPLLYGTNEEADLGLAKFASIVEQKRKETDHLLVVDNGDCIQGTPLMSHYVKEHADRPNPIIETLNTIQIDAAVVGNHEFNFGQSILHQAVKESHFPWLAANVVDSEQNEPYFGQPYLIKTFTSGIKVAIVGATTQYTPNWEKPDHLKGMRFIEATSTLQKWIEHIKKEEKPDVLIVAYHGGFERDIETGEPTEQLTGENEGYRIAQTLPDVDVLLTGHQHRILTGCIDDCLVIQPGHHGSAYGEIQLTLVHSASHGWRITRKKAYIHTLEDVQASEKIIQMVSSLEASTQRWLDQPIGIIQGDMTIINPLHVRLQKHPFIELIQTIQMEASGVDISVTALLSNDSPGFSHSVTMREVVSNYIFPNSLVVLALTGQNIKDAIEQSATYFILKEDDTIQVNPTYTTPKPQHFNYDMWEGIHYIIDVSRPFGSRITHLSYKEEPLQMDREYEVVMNNYRASGGGNFDMFCQKRVVKEIQRDMVDLISDYFQQHPIIKARVTNNFKVVH
ncbi:2',3'-cyclic-nucleotide 2'-phosphodiesterase/3'-nucleotidase [Oikeobacillus pervagus]|uniref:2',3'-cyclic-nucleotide 2'-phosphodiesterase/3'-nucleotidase n=1 Tax=Oikeobacillus pervagus TaxID=1325931 RepID=A0AAJ1WJ70_9BACI|nr:bifunctional UDP-sugar hydrolase/5'-nucleotidase [Oikeobacillus pervagus]MDQ0215148.1 2',3'-cyclic-nucleotide 2'-phosphodiesterase/3'-nucleotidase [Oikeobacillus pervagus]